jgi:hypothetical protein
MSSGVKLNELQVSNGFHNLFIAMWNVNLHFLKFIASSNALNISERSGTERYYGVHGIPSLYLVGPGIRSLRID